MSTKPNNHLSPRFKRSLSMLEEAFEAIPSQTQTFSKGWTQFPRGVSPVFATRADGCYVWDVDGNRYIDWPMGLGPLLLGHNHPAITAAITQQLANGLAFSLPTEAELRLAQRLCRWFPYAERARFAKNGSDVTTAAVRVARAWTKRDMILCCGYHGWHDWYIGTTTRSAGVPDAVREQTVSFPYNDIPALETLLKKHAGKVACVIMEPIGAVEPAPGYLAAVRDLAHQHGALLAYDECWTGFRLHRQGAYGCFGVAPDLACFGKALGNGVPISTIVGRADVMDMFNEVFFSFTFGGDMLGIAAANAVLDMLEREPVIETVAAIGTLLFDGLASLIDEYGLLDCVSLSGYPARSLLGFSNDGADGLLIKSIVQQETAVRGVLTLGMHAPSLAHHENDVQTTLDAYAAAFAVIRGGRRRGNLEELLLGDRVQPVFRKP